MGEIIFNAVLLIFSSILYLEAAGLPSSKWEPLGSGSFPQLVFGALAILALVSLIQKALAYGKRSQEGSTSLRSYRVVGLVFGLFALYLISLNILGFIISTAFFLYITIWLIGPRNEKALPMITGISFVFSVAMFYVFKNYLYVYLPLGIFFN